MCGTDQKNNRVYQLASELGRIQWRRRRGRGSKVQTRSVHPLPNAVERDERADASSPSDQGRPTMERARRRHRDGGPGVAPTAAASRQTTTSSTMVLLQRPDGAAGDDGRSTACVSKRIARLSSGASTSMVSGCAPDRPLQARCSGLARMTRRGRGGVSHTSERGRGGCGSGRWRCWSRRRAAARRREASSGGGELMRGGRGRHAAQRQGNGRCRSAPEEALGGGTSPTRKRRRRRLRQGLGRRPWGDGAAEFEGHGDEARPSRHSCTSL